MSVTSPREEKRGFDSPLSMKSNDLKAIFITPEFLVDAYQAPRTLTLPGGMRISSAAI
jgi:hypothetical protein